MIQTSYYGNSRNFPLLKNTISISRYAPKGFLLAGYASELFPSQELLDSYKDGMITPEQYIEIYKEETLSLLSPERIATKYKDSIFLCYKKAEDFCHRKIVASWLIENGIPCPELETKDKSIGIAIIGSRGFDNYPFFKKIINKFTSNFKHFYFVSGGAKGADSLADRYAQENNIEITIYKPHWSIGRGAGLFRNKTIWNDADIGIAFWDGKSKGTAHSFKIAEEQNKTLYVANYTIPEVYTRGLYPIYRENRNSSTFHCPLKLFFNS